MISKRWGSASRTAAPPQSSAPARPIVLPTPQINQPVLLRGAEGEFASRVEGLEDEGVLILARPFGLELDTGLDIGEPFEVLWTAEAGIFEMPARVTERYVEGKVPIWHAVPAGDVRRTNRRAHKRVPVTVPLGLEIGADRFAASMLDISEAALRCRVPGLHPELEERDACAVFALDDTDFRLQGTVFRATPIGNRTELVITLTLHEDDQTSARLRKAVFAEQIRTRQLER